MEATLKITNHFLFQCLHILWLFKSSRGKGGKNGCSKLSYAIHSLVPSVYLGPTMVGPGKSLSKKKDLTWPENAILNFAFELNLFNFAQRKVHMLVKRYCKDLQIKLAFTSFKI